MDEPGTSTKIDEMSRENVENEENSLPRNFKPFEIFNTLRDRLGWSGLMLNVLLAFLPRPENSCIFNMGLILLILAFW